LIVHGTVLHTDVCARIIWIYVFRNFSLTFLPPAVVVLCGIVQGGAEYSGLFNLSTKFTKSCVNQRLYTVM